MQDNIYVLDPEYVTAEATRQPVRGLERPTPGEIQETFTPDMLSNLPLDASDLALLAALVPGAIVIDPTDSTDAAYSVAGQRTDANVTTLDGMTAGSGQAPQEGLRSTRVVTNTYDVSRGRFSGGMMASTSRNGANMVQGSLSYSLRDHNLAFEGGDSSSDFKVTFASDRIFKPFGYSVATPVACA